MNCNTCVKHRCTCQQNFSVEFMNYRPGSKIQVEGTYTYLSDAKDAFNECMSAIHLNPEPSTVLVELRDIGEQPYVMLSKTASNVELAEAI